MRRPPNKKVGSYVASWPAQKVRLNPACLLLALVALWSFSKKNNEKWRERKL